MRIWKRKVTVKRLMITEIDSVGGVDEPDNPPSLLTFWKRRKKDTPEAGAISKGVAMSEPEAAEPVVEDVGKQEEPDVVEEPAVEAAVEEPAEAEGDDFEKRLQAEQEEVAKARAERDTAIAQLAEEVDKRLNAEWVEKARPYEPLLGPATEIGPLFRKIAGSAPDALDRLEGALKAAMARTDLAKILGEIGKDSGETGTPDDQRDRYVTEMRKLHPDMTVAQARARFWQDHPEAKQASREGV